MTTRSIVTALVIALMLTWGGLASAQQAKCLAGKTKCMSKKAAGLLKCEQTAETPGKVADPTCVTKVEDKFDGGIDATKGCFEKLENKKGSDCITQDDTTAGENAVDACVASIVGAIDPPPRDQTKCGVGKKKCVSKYLAGLLKCQAAAQAPGKPNDPNAGGCIDKAKTKYNGTEPAKGCFAKLEAKEPNDCQIPGDSGNLQAVAENCVAAFVAVLTSTASTTTSTTVASTTTTIAGSTTTTIASTTTTTTPSGAVLKGALAPPTLGRFNYNLKVGLPAVMDACLTQFPGLNLHPCTYAELQSADLAGDLVGLMDTANTTVTSFWAIDDAQDPLQQCNDDNAGGSKLNWEYGTAHTMSRGQKVPLNTTGPNAGHLGSLQTSQQCALLGTPAWVG